MRFYLGNVLLDGRMVLKVLVFYLGKMLLDRGQYFKELDKLLAERLNNRLVEVEAMVFKLTL